MPVAALSPTDAQRLIDDAVAFEQQATDQVGQRSARQPRLIYEFDALITCYVAMAAGRWRYSWIEMIRQGDSWYQLAGGRSGSATAASGYALNSDEAFNDQTAGGIGGNSVDPSTDAEQYIVPVRGYPVVRMRQTYAPPGNGVPPLFSFSYENEKASVVPPPTTCNTSTSTTTTITTTIGGGGTVPYNVPSTITTIPNPTYPPYNSPSVAIPVASLVCVYAWTSTYNGSGWSTPAQAGVQCQQPPASTGWQPSTLGPETWIAYNVGSACPGVGLGCNASSFPTTPSIPTFVPSNNGGSGSTPGTTVTPCPCPPPTLTINTSGGQITVTATSGTSSTTATANLPSGSTTPPTFAAGETSCSGCTGPKTIVLSGWTSTDGVLNGAHTGVLTSACVYGTSIDGAGVDKVDGSGNPYTMGSNPPGDSYQIVYELALQCVTNSSGPPNWQLTITNITRGTLVTINLAGGGPGSPSGATGTGVAAGGETISVSVE